MITVITGMEVHPFDRLVKAVDEGVRDVKITDEVFVQRGHTPYKPQHVPYEDFISFGDLCSRIEQSDLIITHAGAGSTLTCLQCKKRPIIVPRLCRYGEHVDDHQLPFSQKLHESGLARQVLDMSELLDAIRAEKGQGPFVPNGVHPASRIVSYLEGFWAETGHP